MAIYQIPGFPHYTISDDMVVVSTRGRCPRVVGNEKRVGLYGRTYGKARLLYCAKNGINPSSLPVVGNIVFTDSGVSDRRHLAAKAMHARLSRGVMTEQEQRQRLVIVRRRCDELIAAIDNKDFSSVIDEILDVIKTDGCKKNARARLHRKNADDILFEAACQLIDLIVKDHVPIPNYELYIQKLCMKIRNQEIKNRKLYGYQDDRLHTDQEP